MQSNYITFINFIFSYMKFVDAISNDIVLKFYFVMFPDVQKYSWLLYVDPVFSGLAKFIINPKSV